MKSLSVRHSTIYRYSDRVRFGTHRLMTRPRDSHDLRLLSSRLMLSPPGTLRWVHDVFGNSVAFADFAQTSAQLTIVSTLHLERFAIEAPNFAIADSAATYPFVYSTQDRTDLGRLLEQHYPDPKGVVEAWARQFVRRKPVDTQELLTDLNGAIKASFAYAQRDDEGTQSPVQTIERASGSCRDFALLLIEAARCLGIGARFVTGYIYDPVQDASHVQGAGATHAWADLYLPGAGWVEYDPTNGLVAGENLIRVAVTRDPSQAVPVSGSFVGPPASFLAMEVDVKVTSEGAARPS
jgi:transglutaminase-like putative cysteine protease